MSTESNPRPDPVGFVIINNVKYVPEKETGPIKIAVLQRGFVYVGHVSRDDDLVTIRNARCLIRWGTTKHLAELANNGPLPEARLGDRCTIEAFLPQVIYTIPVSQEKWNEHC